MNILRTPEERFEDLPGFRFQAHYKMVAKELRMHYIDEGDKAGSVVLLLHGEPSWSYLYRKMIPAFTAAGFRVIAPDLIGFGRSDKLAEQQDYSYAAHLEWLASLVEQLDLQGIHLFCQDWGGLLGLRLAVTHSERFASITASNTALPTGQVEMPPAFRQWQEFSQKVPILPVGKILDNGTVKPLTPEVMAAYEAPYPDESFKAGARIFPMLVPTDPEDEQAQLNRQAWAALAKWKKPFLTLFADQDPIMKGVEKIFISIIPGAKGQAHEIIPEAGHFIQEDQGELLAQKMLQFIQEIE